MDTCKTSCYKLSALRLTPIDLPRTIMIVRVSFVLSFCGAILTTARPPKRKKTGCIRNCRGAEESNESSRLEIRELTRDRFYRSLLNAFYLLRTSLSNAFATIITYFYFSACLRACVRARTSERIVYFRSRLIDRCSADCAVRRYVTSRSI